MNNQETYEYNRHLISEYNLTAREFEVLAHLMYGLKNLEIANKLFITEKTVKFHLTKMFKSFNVKNRQALIMSLVGSWQYTEEYLEKIKKAQVECPLCSKVGIK